MMNIEQYSKYSQFYDYEIPQMLLDLLNSTEWRACVDLGCGDGALLAALHNKGYFENKTIFGVDSSADRITAASDISEGINLLVSDACQTNIDTGSIDLVVTTEVIEHVDDDIDLIIEMRRILRKGGLIYLTTPFKKSYGWYFYRCNGKWTLDPTHIREYTDENQLLNNLRSHGFEILESKKTIEGRPVLDAILRRLKAPRSIYNNPILRALRGIRIPIPGYYHWEIICRKA